MFFHMLQKLDSVILCSNIIRSFLRHESLKQFLSENCFKQVLHDVSRLTTHESELHSKRTSLTACLLKMSCNYRRNYVCFGIANNVFHTLQLLLYISSSYAKFMNKSTSTAVSKTWMSLSGCYTHFIYSVL